MIKPFMARLLYLFCATLLFSSILTGTVYAQNCDTAYEIIAELRKPKWGAYNVWDTIYGDIESDEIFEAAVNSVENDNIVAAGTRTDTKTQKVSMILTEIDRRGRPVWEKGVEIEGLKNIVKILSYKDEYLVLANLKATDDRGILWLGYFDKTGELGFNRKFSRSPNDLNATDMAISRDNGVLLISVHLASHNKAMPAQTLLYWYSAPRKSLIRSRVLSLGAENRINALKQNEENDNFYAAGYIRGDDGRMAGWILNMGADGRFLWQRQFARGLGGSFDDIVEFAQGEYLMVAGEAYAADDTGRKAAWVLAVDKNGENVAWQRYYRENHEMQVRSLMRHDDEQISVLIDAKNSALEEDKDYVRLITLNPRGVILSNNTYFNAEGGGAFGMTQGLNASRVFYGYTDVDFQKEKEKIEAGEAPFEKIRSRQGWLVAADAPDQYVDPCKVNVRELP